eukprot:3505555-Prymnesium_polylepis.2
MASSAAEVAAEIRASGDPIPAGVVAGIAAQVAEVSGQKLPSTIALKRTFISNWYAEFGAKLLTGGRSQEGENGRGISPPQVRSARAAEPVDRDDLLRTLDSYAGELIPSSQVSADSNPRGGFCSARAHEDADLDVGGPEVAAPVRAAVGRDRRSDRAARRSEGAEEYPAEAHVHRGL